MSKFTYVGDPNDDFSGPSELTVGGHTFAKGEATEVDDALAAKLKGHSHFAGEGDEAIDPDQARGASMSMDDLRAILDGREVTYKKNQGRKALVDLVVESGGFPGADGDE